MVSIVCVFFDVHLIFINFFMSFSESHCILDYNGKAGKPHDNLELRGNHYGALCKRRKVNEGRLENLVVYIKKRKRESWKTLRVSSKALWKWQGKVGKAPEGLRTTW